jgi:hypothetical protein
VFLTEEVEKIKQILNIRITWLIFLEQEGTKADKGHIIWALLSLEVNISLPLNRHSSSEDTIFIRFYLGFSFSN